MVLPEEGFRAFPENIPPELKPPNGGPGLNTVKYDASDGGVSASVLIDAENGAVVHRPGFPGHSKAQANIAICQFDPATAPWPYNCAPPEESTAMEPSIQPDPATGMYADFMIGSGGYQGVIPTPADCDFAWEGISVRNWRSSAFIGRDDRTGSVCKNLSYVQPEDLAAFQRFLDRVELCVYQDAEY